MESLISGLAAHGYSLLFAAVFLEAVGFPVLAALKRAGLPVEPVSPAEMAVLPVFG